MSIRALSASGSDSYDSGKNNCLHFPDRMFFGEPLFTVDFSWDVAYGALRPDLSSTCGLEAWRGCTIAALPEMLLSAREEVIQHGNKPDTPCATSQSHLRSTTRHRRFAFCGQVFWLKSLIERRFLRIAVPRPTSEASVPWEALGEADGGPSRHRASFPSSFTRVD